MDSNEGGNPPELDGFSFAAQAKDLAEARVEGEKAAARSGSDRLAADPAMRVTQIEPRHRIKLGRLGPFDHAQDEERGVSESLKGLITSDEAVFAVVNLNLAQWQQGYIWVKGSQGVRRDEVDNYSYAGADVLVELADKGQSKVVGVLSDDGQAVVVDRSEANDQNGLRFSLAFDPEGGAVLTNYSRDTPIELVEPREAEYDGINPSSLTPPLPHRDSMLDQDIWRVDADSALAAVETARRIDARRRAAG